MAGCRVDGLTEPRHTAADRVPQEQPLPAPSSPGAGTVKPTETSPIPAPALPREKPAAMDASPDIGPDRVLGLDGQAVEALLGQPDFVRRENPMELWRYRHEGCAVALFLYTEEGNGRGPLRVRHIEAWAPGEEETPPRECLSTLAGRVGKNPAN